MAANTQMLMKRRILRGGLQSISPQQFSDIQSIFLDAQTQYQVIAQEAIDDSFAGVPKKEVTVIVDNSAGKPISQAKLFNRHGIYATRLGGIEDVRAAYEEAIAFIKANAPYKTGYYKKSANTSDFFTVRRVIKGGAEIFGEAIDWDTFGPQSSIEIYSRARYAAPLEVLRSEACLGAAYNKISSRKGISLTFQYKDPTKYSQVKMYRKSDGQAFRDLTVPVLTIASIRNTSIMAARRKDGKPPVLKGRTGRNIQTNRPRNLLKRGIYKGPLKGT